MKKINFKKLLVSTDISRKHCENVDCRESFANVLYQQGNGIAFHALALKIYNADENTEYSDEEIRLIRECVDVSCKPFFIDAINRAIENQPEKNNDKQE